MSKRKEYVVLRHKILGANGHIFGIIFRDSYGVVEKNSKAYKRLKSMPVIKSDVEYPLTHLPKLKFIISESDILRIYGKDVFNKYKEDKKVLELEQSEEYKKQKEEEHNTIYSKCKFRKDNGELCSNDAWERSPAGYCKNHLIEDPF